MIYFVDQKSRRSVLVAATLLAAVLLVYVSRTSSTNHPQPRWPSFSAITTSPATDKVEVERVALVVTSQTTDNTTWLEESFPMWEEAVYLTDATLNLSVPVNKGRESMVYLTYVFVVTYCYILL